MQPLYPIHMWQDQETNWIMTHWFLKHIYPQGSHHAPLTLIRSLLIIGLTQEWLNLGTNFFFKNPNKQKNTGRFTKMTVDTPISWMKMYQSPGLQPSWYFPTSFFICWGFTREGRQILVHFCLKRKSMHFLFGWGAATKCICFWPMAQQKWQAWDENRKSREE